MDTLNTYDESDYVSMSDDNSESKSVNDDAYIDEITHNKLMNTTLSFINSLNELPLELIMEELCGFDMFLITDSSTKPGYVSGELMILKTYGNGLCWINALLVSIFGKFWQNTAMIDLWIQGLITTFGLSSNFVPVLNLYLYNINFTVNCDGINEYDVIKFLNSNKLLMYILSFNILKFAIENYNNVALNKIEKLCPLETAIAFNEKKQKFYAIDGQLRNFIMAIMGIEKVVVFQNNVEPKHRRYTNKDFNLKAIDYEGEYAGFEIETFHNLNCSGTLGNVLLFTHNSEHYDAIFNSNTFQTCLALNDYLEMLPEFIKIDL